MDLKIFSNKESFKVIPEQLKIDKADLDIYVNGKIYESVDLVKKGEYDRFDDREIEFLGYERIFESPDFSESDIDALLRMVDNLRLEYEIEVQFYR